MIAVVLVLVFVMAVGAMFYSWRQDDMESRVQALSSELDIARMQVRLLQAEVEEHEQAEAGREEDLSDERFAPPELLPAEEPSPAPSNEPWFTIEESSLGGRWFVFDNGEVLIDLMTVDAVVYVAEGETGDGKDDETRIYCNGQKIVSITGNVTAELSNALLGRDPRALESAPDPTAN